MDYQKVLKCTCGGTPRFLCRVCLTYDSFSCRVIDSDYDLTEYAVQCPDCKGISYWVERRQGGMKTAISLWNDMILQEMEVG